MLESFLRLCHWEGSNLSLMLVIHKLKKKRKKRYSSVYIMGWNIEVLLHIQLYKQKV